MADPAFVNASGQAVGGTTTTATNATVTPGAWTLYRGTAIVQPRVDQPSLIQGN